MKTLKMKPGASTRVSLYDEQTVLLDDGPKSVAYFCKKIPTTVNRSIISELKRVAGKFGGRDVRLCLHRGPEAPLHEMIVLGRASKYYRAHKHMKKEESFHMLEGKMGVVCFTDEGKVLDSCILDHEEDFIYRVSANTYHTVIPLTEMVVYKESKLGPFIPNTNDSIYPAWATEDHSPDVKEYLRILIEGLNGKSK